MVPRSLLPFIKMYSVFIVDCVWERYWRSPKEFLPKKWSFSELRVSQRVVWLGKIVRRAVDNQFNLPDLSPSAVCDRELRWNPLEHFRWIFLNLSSKILCHSLAIMDKMSRNTAFPVVDYLSCKEKFITCHMQIKVDILF